MEGQTAASIATKLQVPWLLPLFAQHGMRAADLMLRHRRCMQARMRADNQDPTAQVPPHPYGSSSLRATASPSSAVGTSSSLTASQHNATLHAIHLGAQAGVSSIPALNMASVAGGGCRDSLLVAVDSLFRQLVPALKGVMTKEMTAAAGTLKVNAIADEAQRMPTLA